MIKTLENRAKIMKTDLFTSLNAFTNETRMEIIKILHQHDRPVAFKTLLKDLGYSPNNSSLLANHLKKLMESNLITKELSFYSLTKLAKQLFDQIDGMEKLIEEHNRDIMVRTSDFCFEPFDEMKIAQNLMREADFCEDEAILMAKKTKRELFNANIEYLTAPLIREYTNFILIQSGKEEARHKLTRLGLPPYDVKKLLREGEFENSNMLYHELGKHIMEQFLLLNLLPQRFADFYLSGTIFFLNPESWGLNPLEVVIPGTKFSKLLIQLCNEYDLSPPVSQTSYMQFLPLVIKNIIEDFKDFFSGGVLITEFESVIHQISQNFQQSAETILDLFIELVPSLKIDYSHDQRNIHSRTWEIWFEVDLNNFSQYPLEIDLIISKYHQDTETYQDVLSGSIPFKKPNLILNLSPEIRSTLIEAKLFRELPDLLKKILEIAPIHNITFISPSKNFKRLLTPHLNPVNCIDKDSSILILDKIYVNLPKLVEETENTLGPRNYCTISSKQDNQNPTQKPNPDNRGIMEFLQSLNFWICESLNFFEEKMSILSKNIGKLANWRRVSKMLFMTDPFEKPTDLIGYKGCTPIVCGVCLNGLIETVRYFTNFPPDKHQDSLNLLIDIVSTASNVLRSNSKADGVKYVLSQNHVDNYLQVRYKQDSVLLSHLEEKYLNLENHPNHTERYVPAYHYSVFLNHDIENLKKIASNFKLYQKNMNLAYLNIFLHQNRTKNQILDAFKIFLKNRIHAFGFSQILKWQDNLYFRYAGSYKPLSYYGNAIRELVQQ